MSKFSSHFLIIAYHLLFRTIYVKINARFLLFFRKKVLIIKRYKNFIATFILAIFIFTLIPTTTFASPILNARDEHEITILFTHDLHSQLLPSSFNQLGGFAQLASVIDNYRTAQSEETIFLFDGGDFSMGSLFQGIFETHAPELVLMGQIGYDAITFGNHEFDYRAQSLANMLNAAFAQSTTLPAITIANYTPPQPSDSTYDEGAQALQEAYQNCSVKDYVMLEKNGVRVAVFGLIGTDANDCSPLANMIFTDPIQRAKEIVQTIQTNETYDYIVCLSHSGTNANSKKSEDYQLAEQVPQIDVIVSGHTHSTFSTPQQVGQTYIVSAGPSCRNLGVLKLRTNGDKNTLVHYELLPITSSIAPNDAIQAKIAEYKQIVNQEFLAQYNLTFDTKLTYSEKSIPFTNQLGVDEPLAHLITDSYLYAVQQVEGEAYVPIDFAVVVSGVVRASLPQGDISLNDAFNISSLGYSIDHNIGYPLASVYLTVKELKTIFEIDASISPLLNTTKVYGSGMYWEYNMSALPLNRVKDSYQVLPDGTVKELEDDKLYRVVAQIYLGQMLSSVTDLSYGILSITPKDKNGVPIADLNDHIIYINNHIELKEWYALVSYLNSFDEIPSQYFTGAPHKVAYRSLNPIEIFKSPNKISFLAITFVIVTFALLIFSIKRMLKKRLHRNRI